ncbi:MAG: T9SS type A sorting domain-containing protein [Fibrobacteres bacterium]|nr:T9SS type A sorting domain-containing protein [Fibrobacterota bacterium]
MAYDPVNHELVLFGGCGIDGDSGHLGGTWLFSTSTKTWQKLTTSVSPPPRAYSPMAYDPKSASIVLFGGDHLDYQTADTWVYHCATRTWEKRAPTISPSPRAGHAMLYLPKCGKIALLAGFGLGVAPTYGYYRQFSEIELWTYDVSTNIWQNAGHWLTSDSATPRLNTAEAIVSAADTADNILLHVKRDNEQSVVYKLHFDAADYDAAATSTLGVSPGTVSRRAGGFIPDWYTSGVSAPDTAAVETQLRSLSTTEWTKLTPPKGTTIATFDWGTSRYDPESDMIMSFNGGHSTYGGNQVMQYSPHTGRFSCGYDAEAQLEYVGASGVWWQPPTFANRPFMPNHAWASYDFCPALKRMILLMGYYTYFYDPVKQDWDGYTKSSFYVGAVQSGRAIRAGRNLFSWQRGLICRMDTLTRQWVKVLERSDVPRMYTEETAACYDPVNKRVVLFAYYGYVAATARTYFYYPETNRLDSLPLAADSVLRGYLTKPLSNTTREAVFLSKQNGVLFQTMVDSTHQLFFNCMNDSWELKKVPYIKIMGSNCTGLMYDERRDLIWMYSPGYDGKTTNMYVLPASTIPTTSSEIISQNGNVAAGLSVAPNPTNPFCSMTLSLANDSRVELTVHDITGKQVAVVVSKKLTGGQHRFVWDGHGSSSGVYFVKLKTMGKSYTQKVVLQR